MMKDFRPRIAIYWPTASIRVSQFNLQLICLKLIYIHTMGTYTRLFSSSLESAKVNPDNSHSTFSLLKFGIKKMVSNYSEHVKNSHPGKQWNRTQMQADHTCLLYVKRTIFSYYSVEFPHSNCPVYRAESLGIFGVENPNLVQR